jgi:hypothetical protein
MTPTTEAALISSHADHQQNGLGHEVHGEASGRKLATGRDSGFQGVETTPTRWTQVANQTEWVRGRSGAWQLNRSVKIGDRFSLLRQLPA